MLSLYLALSSQTEGPYGASKNLLKRPIRASEGRTASNPRLGPQRGHRRPPRGLWGRGMDSQTFGGIRPAAARHPYRGGGYRLTPSGLRAPAHHERQPKPRALSGRGGWLRPTLLAFSRTVQQGSEDFARLDANAAEWAGQTEGGRSARQGGAKAPSWRNGRRFSLRENRPPMSGAPPARPARSGLGVALTYPRRGEQQFPQDNCVVSPH